MRIYVLSDLHLERGDFEVPAVDADVVVVAGDLHVGIRGLPWSARRLPDVPIVYVPGNHEYYRESMPKLVDKMRIAAGLVGGRIEVLSRGEVVIDGVVFLGATLWTDYGLRGDRASGMAIAAEVMNDFRMIRVDPGERDLTPEDVLAAHQRERRWLEEAFARHRGRTVVVVTHHPPSAASVPARRLEDPWSPVYASHLDAVVESSRASLWVHGHTHHPVDYRIGRTRVVSNPRGYVDAYVPDGFRPDLVVEV